jgi:hypothetical protein
MSSFLGNLFKKIVMPVLCKNMVLCGIPIFLFEKNSLQFFFRDCSSMHLCACARKKITTTPLLAMCKMFGGLSVNRKIGLAKWKRCPFSWLRLLILP